MATVTLTEITQTANRYAYVVWLMPGGTTQTTYLTGTEHDTWASMGEPPGKPDPNAQFVISGLRAAFNTLTGRPRPGDFWVKNAMTREVVLFLGNEPDWALNMYVADRPVNGRSRVRGFNFEGSGNTITTTLTAALLNRLRVGTLTRTIGQINIVNNVATIPAGYIRKIADPIDTFIDNHESVTFDAQANVAGNDVSDLTFAFTVANHTNRAIVVGWTIRGETPSTYTYAGTTLGSARTSDTTSGDQATYLYGLKAPATGSNNVVLTPTGQTYMTGSIGSFYNVDQTTPFAGDTHGHATNTHPALTIGSGSATGMNFTHVIWASTSITNTPDATWTTVTRATTTNNYLSVQCGYITGAASVTRTDTTSGSVYWVVVGNAILPVAAAGGNIFRIPLLNGLGTGGPFFQNPLG